MASVLLGGAIGYEREMRRQPAGLRTHVLGQGGLLRLVRGVGGEEVADLDPVLVVERRRRFDQLVVDVGLVAALQVFDEVATLNERDLGVDAADGLVGNDVVTILGLAAQDDPRFV